MLGHVSHPGNAGIPAKLVKWSLLVVVILALAIAGVLAYIWFSGGSGQPSHPTTAPSLVVSGTARLFHLMAEKSEVRFIIDETLLGQPKTVIGATKDVAGDIAVDFGHPANSVLGQIRVNMRTLKTDNEFRTRALRGQILESTKPEYEFASFAPRQLIGLPERVTVGQPFTFQIIGSLTVRGVTREVTFEATVTPTSREQLQGSAWATIRYPDFNLSIPEAPGVANISESVRLEIDFVAMLSQ